MKNSDNLELLLDVIGIEPFSKLLECCAGMSFYIPKATNKRVCIIKDIKLLSEFGLKKREIIRRLSRKYERSERSLRRIYDEV